ncbi:epimerase [Erythrobacter longus]|uniref:Epimerase n=1 Tax=Erythrobacter longus TaxID=1044 RepID=A0A074M9L8_ERYLO|nr:NAD(P)-dependent oxidoreductase [Erythrobacter longus]KEO88518.1 epimerase [Erythrobacter longus]
MKVILTGSSGRIGRAIFSSLAPAHEVVGVDTRAFSTTRIVADCGDEAVMRPLLEGADAVIHTGGPHAPHVGVVPDKEFTQTNVDATAKLYAWASEAGTTAFLYTSTTALYGHAISPGQCTWLDEETVPLPKTIYHRTKLAAEKLLEAHAAPHLPVRVLRMSRCFPESAPQMATYRLHRGIDARDVGEAHLLALHRAHHGPAFARFVISGATPFRREDCEALSHHAPAVIRERAPKLAEAFEARRWTLPSTIDRIYDPGRAMRDLGWKTRWGWEEVLAQTDRHDLEVLPTGAPVIAKAE